MNVTFVSYASVSNEVRDANAQIVKGLGLPEYRGSGPLAIVGGGPSIDEHIDELRNWPGTIWAVNGTINWCLDHGLFDAYFYTIDAAPIENWVYDLSRIRRATLAPDCSPSLFERLKGADISLLPLPDGGPTSAAAADWLSIQVGHHPITWFGCESSFGENSTHAYAAFSISEWIKVRVGDKEFSTKPEFVEQAKIMAEVIRAAPNVYSEKSGGLLRAMVEHGMEYEVTGISEKLFAKLKDAA